MSDPCRQADATSGSGDVDSTKAKDPVDSIELIARSRDRWRQAALACLVLSLLLFLLSCVQIWGTYAAIKLVQETQEETKRLKAEHLERTEEAWNRSYALHSSIQRKANDRQNELEDIERRIAVYKKEAAGDWQRHNQLLSDLHALRAQNAE